MIRRAAMARTSFNFNPARLRSWGSRLPFFTRYCCLLILLLSLLGLAVHWLPASAALVPNDVGLLSMHRLNTYPLVDSGLLSTLLTVAILIPFLERFEIEHGSLTTLALFAGPFSTLPGIMYILIDGYSIIWTNTSVQGPSVWIFLLFANETVRTYKSHPYLQLSSYQLPTWPTPIIVAMLVSVLLPRALLPGPKTASFLLHLAGCVVGYAFAFAYLRFLVPPERACRWLENRFSLLDRLPHYVSVERKMVGRYGAGLPTASSERALEEGARGRQPSVSEEGLLTAPDLSNGAATAGSAASAARNYMARSPQRLSG